MTLDVLQLALDHETGNPFFRAEDVKNTRVVISDDLEEGPFYDQWAAFSGKPVVRLNNLPSVLKQASVNIIAPLPGSANPLWQDDWEPKECGQSNLLQLFSQRMLSFYNVMDDSQSPNKRLVFTFIDRREKRSLVDKEFYISQLKTTYPYIEINLVNLASLSFTEQLRTIRKINILAGVHGAGLTHGIFLQPLSTIMEILPHGFDHKGFRNLAKILRHQYFTTHASDNATHESKGWQYDDVYIEQDRFNGLIDTAIKSMDHRNS